MTCHDPPLEETDIPNGLWLCHTCTMKEKMAREKDELEKANIKEVVQTSPSPESSGVGSQMSSQDQPSTSSSGLTDVDMKESESTTEIAIDSEPMLVDDESNKDQKEIEVIVEPEPAKVEKEPEVVVVEEQEIEKAPEVEELSPFEELIRVASLLNPKQFELPVEMTEPFPFPGTERVEPIRNGRRVKNKRLIELDSHGCVPLPAKLCFSCNKSCKKAPLISCDYCTLFFHQDCLNPPMTALPAGRWMCPNHPQHFIVSLFFNSYQQTQKRNNFFFFFKDWHLVSSISATERMKIWDQYGTDPIDHEVIKLQFFRKVHMKNPPFRTKLKPKSRYEVEVPDVVRYHYENPPSLLPSLRDVMRVDNLRKRGTVPVDFPRADIAQADDDLEAMDLARKRLKTIFSDQDDVHGLLVEPEKEKEIEEVTEKLNRSKDSSRKSKRSKSFAKDMDTSTEEIKIEVDTAEVKLNESVEVVVETSAKKLEGSLAVVEVKQEVVEANTPTADSNTSSILLPTELQSINEQLCNLDMDTIKLLAFQRLQQIVNENPNFIQKFQDKSTASQAVTEIAKWDVHRFPIPLPNVVKDEGVDEKSYLPIVRMREQPFHLRSEDEKAHSLALSLERPINRSKIRSRAVLTFANDYLSGRVWFSVAPSLNLSVCMRYRSFAVGFGAENDLDLSKFGTCAFVSPRHAVLFYDDVTKQFELLNYSEFGSEVNGQLFSCDFTEHPKDVCETPTSPLKDKRVAIQSKIKNMLDAKKKIREGIEKSGNDIT